MNITDIKKQFSPSDQIIIKRFLAFVNENSLKDSNFSDDASLAELNQFSEMAETDDDIKNNVREWLRLKKVRLRGNFTNN
jgi:hypothetical protein